MTLCIPLLPLESGLFALVDAKDFWALAEYEWRMLSGYVFTNGYRRSGTLVYMHRAVAGAGDSDAVDHINGNKRDNRRSNLRVCTDSENAFNRRKYRTSSSGRPTLSRYKGVSFENGLWVAACSRPNYGGSVRLGRYTSEVEAASAYDNFAREVFGEFARLNFPEAGEQCALEAATC